MNSVALIQRLHEHRIWVNQQLLAAALDIDEPELRREFGIGQGSIWKTLTHLYAAEFVWLAALEGDEDPLTPGDIRGKLPGNQEDSEQAVSSTPDLVERWNALDRRWRSYLAGLDESNLDGVVYKVSTSSAKGQRKGTRRSDILLHVCTHAQYTTAQAVNMMRQVGHTPLPDAMLITMARSESRTDTES